MNAKPARSSKRGAWIIAGSLAVAIIVAAVIAVVASSGGEDSTADAEAAGLQQTRDAAIEGAALPEFIQTAQDPAVGRPAPTIAGQSFDGTAVDIAPGTPTLVVFLAHWCPHCQNEVPELVEWEASGGVPNGVQIVGVATGTSPQRPNYPPSAWLGREGFPFPVIADTESAAVAASFGLTGYPYFVMLDEAGNVISRASGELGIDAIAALAAAANPA